MSSSHVAKGQDRAHRSDEPAIQVICLGAGGGPSEDCVTGLLVRATAANWAKGSVLAVDAGSHMASIMRILENHFPRVSEAVSRKTDASPIDETPSPNEAEAADGGPVKHTDSPETESRTSSPAAIETVLPEGAFAGLPFPHASARANAAHIVRDYVSTYLITHPHLDHLSGFAINTAALQNTIKPKRLAALPFTVEAIKTHIFNDVVWPNMSDENDGICFVTFQRLKEGGSNQTGEGHSSGFLEICNGLAVKGFKVSHGHCNRVSNPGPQSQHRRSNVGIPEVERSTSIAHTHSHTPGTPFGSKAADGGRRGSIFSQPSQPGTPTVYEPPQCVVDSSAFFIRAEGTGREVLIFGDVEPDSLSLLPRTDTVWAHAAPKIATGALRGIFIECSFSDEQPDQYLFGHLSPRHLIAELQNLAAKVIDERVALILQNEMEANSRKRKRRSTAASVTPVPERRKTPPRAAKSMPLSLNAASDALMKDATGPGTAADTPSPSLRSPISEKKLSSTSSAVHHLPAAHAALKTPPLQGVQVVIIHVKDTLTDGPWIGERILAQCQAREQELAKSGEALGCEFLVSKEGGSYWF